MGLNTLRNTVLNADLNSFLRIVMNVSLLRPTISSRIFDRADRYGKKLTEVLADMNSDAQDKFIKWVGTEYRIVHLIWLLRDSIQENLVKIRKDATDIYDKDPDLYYQDALAMPVRPQLTATSLTATPKAETATPHAPTSDKSPVTPTEPVAVLSDAQPEPPDQQVATPKTPPAKQSQLQLPEYHKHPAGYGNLKKEKGGALTIIPPQQPSQPSENTLPTPSP